jgi:hypothetical protein
MRLSRRARRHSKLRRGASTRWRGDSQDAGFKGPSLSSKGPSRSSALDFVPYPFLSLRPCEADLIRTTIRCQRGRGRLRRRCRRSANCFARPTGVGSTAMPVITA